MNNTVFLISGKSNSGKGEVSCRLEELFKADNSNVIRCSLSTYIRDILQNDFYWDGHSDMINARKFMAETYRLGSIIYPYHMARRVWERDIVPYLKPGIENYIIVESFREIQNYDYFKMLLDDSAISKIITCRVTRPEFTAVDEELSEHISETDLDNFNFDYHVINDGCIEDLYNKVDEIYKTMKMVKFYTQYTSW